jgi:hypothetical protein
MQSEAGILVDLEDVDIPFVSDDNDAYSQDEILAHLYHGFTSRKDALEFLKDQIQRPVALSSYEKMYKSKMNEEAMRSLHKYQYLEIDQDMMYDPHDPDLLYRSPCSYIDALIMSPNYMGLDAVLPRAIPDAGYRFNMTFSQQHRQFKSKYARLGFDPVNSMLYMGRCREEEVWLALGYDLGSTQPSKSPQRNIDTTMPDLLYFPMLAFLAYALHDAGLLGVTITDRLLIPSSMVSRADIYAYTNLL